MHFCKNGTKVHKIPYIKSFQIHCQLKNNDIMADLSIFYYYFINFNLTLRQIIFIKKCYT